VLTLLLGVVMVVGLAGVLIPLLPGTALILAAGIAWAVFVVEEGAARWLVVAAMAALFVVGLVLKYALPGRHLAGALPRQTLVAGGVGALAGFVLLPPLGLVIGGVAGVYVAERRRVPDARAAWRGTVQVLRAIGIGLVTELAAGVLMITCWLIGVLAL
jgi:uncharacterized protein YqgC (DUF456 family)